ncbi:MAG: RHS repeat protein, partial [Verrucomicrobiales bacterium]|nr:RHS repeat protein [Verrucomicrobiales bacterium]
RVASVTDRRGQTHRIVYHPSGRIAAFVNARGSRIELSYVARDQTLSNPFEADSIPCTFFDLSRGDHPDGSFESFEYDARGNITASRDRAGARTTFAYDARGQVTASTNATGGVVRRVYDAHANLVSVADSDGVLTRYGYDALFRRTSVTNADDTVVRYEHDALDRLKAVVDERSTRLALAYDANGNLTQLTRAEGTPLAQTRTIEYDALDRLERFLDPAGFATTLSYTYRGALAEAVFPDNARIRIGYDRRQFPVQLVDESGKEFLLHRDPEGLPTLLRTAAGREFRAAFDAVGFAGEIFDGNTNRYRLAYDAGLRLTNIVDALGRSIGTVRDPEGRLAARTVPILGTTSYERNGLGLITRLSDFRGSTWDFEYTPMGRPKSIRDPAARTWAMTYDDRGRLETVVHPDGEVETILYDAVSSPIGRQFSSGLRLAFARDALRRITNTASIPVRKTFDVRDQPVGQTIHETTFTASYDARRRLRSLEYAALSTITYTYDARGLATRISDSRSGAFVELDHDDDRFLRSVRRSNGVTTRYERDPNGRVVRIQHVGKADLKLTRDATGDVVRSLVTGVLNVASHLPAEAVNFAYDAANQPGGAGFVHDSRGRRTQDPKRQYTWDAADRLLSVRQDGTTVLDEYTATGEVAIQSVQGADTEFFYHDAIPNRPVLAERRSGEFRRYYIYTPEGALVFAVEVPANTPSFHHFDVSGTTLFLTGANGSVTDSYGYTPYGRLVRHEGSSEQPFTFHGELGVRQVGATGLYQMGARFYDSWTARFLSRDPSWSNLLEVHTELNPYGFARQNPVRFADPTGHRSFPSLSSLLDVLARRNPQPGDVVAAPDANGFLDFGFRREQSEREENQRRAGQPDESFESFFSKSPFGKAPGSTKAPTDPTGFITASLGATATGQSLEQIVSPTLVRRMTPAESVRRIEVTKTTRDLAEEGLDVLPEIAPMRRDRCFGIDHCSLSGAGSTSGSRSRMPRVLLLAGLIGFWWLGRFAVGRPRP